MYLYHLTLQNASYIPHAVAGCFSHPRTLSTTADKRIENAPETPDELVVQRGSNCIELLRLNPETGRLRRVSKINLFATIRSLATLRFPGEDVDYLAVGTDSGRLVILSHSSPIGSNFSGSKWIKVGQETFGRSGVRRCTPGEYIACDPLGRAVMVAALEKQKLAYLVSRGVNLIANQNSPSGRGMSIGPELVLSSPLEAHRSNTITYALVGLDVGFETPLFAALEISYPDPNFDGEISKMVSFYSVDLGLNHVTRRWTEAVPQPANRMSHTLLPVPCTLNLVTNPISGSENKSNPHKSPGGAVLVLSQGSISYHRIGQSPVVAVWPQLKSNLFTTGQIVKIADGSFFHLVQTECSILYKLTLVSSNDGIIDALNLQLFSEKLYKSPRTALVVLPSGFLFSPGQSSTPHSLFQITSLAEDRPYIKSVPTISPLHYVSERSGSSGTNFPSLKNQIDSDTLSNEKNAVTNNGINADTSQSSIHIPVDYESLDSAPKPNHSSTKFEDTYYPSSVPSDINELGVETNDDYKETDEESTLLLTDEIENFSRITCGSLFTDEKSNSGSLRILQGSSNESLLSLMKQGLKVTELAAAPLPHPPVAVWTLESGKSNYASTDDSSPESLIIISYATFTTILRIDTNGNVEEEISETDIANDFIRSVKTLEVCVLYDESIAQVHREGIRHMKSGAPLNEWRPPADSFVIKAACNRRQIAVLLSDGILVYFELDPVSLKIEEKGRLEAGLAQDGRNAAIRSFAFGPVPKGLLRARYMAVGLATDSTLRILACDPHEILEPRGIQALAAIPASIIFSTSADLSVGLENGVLVSLRLDTMCGDLVDSRTRFLGSGSPVRLFSLTGSHESSKSSLVAITTTPWLIDGPHVTPLILPTTTELNKPQTTGAYTSRSTQLIGIAPFPSDANGFVAISSKSQTLFIYSVEDTQDRFMRPSGESLKLSFTPRDLVPARNLPGFSILTESDFNLPKKQITSTKNGDATGLKIVHKVKGGISNARLSLLRPDNTIAASLDFHGKFISSAITLQFHDKPPGHAFVAIGVCENFNLMPRRAQKSHIYLYQIVAGSGSNITPKGQSRESSSFSFNLIHMTDLDGEIASCMTSFAGRLLAGVGGFLRLYDLGKARLLRRCEHRMRSFVTALDSQGWRVAVGESQATVVILRYLPIENRFAPLAEDVQPRSVTRLLFLDAETIALADRFGSIAVLRVPPSVVDDDYGGAAIAMASSAAAVTGKGAEILVRIADFYLGDCVTLLERAPIASLTSCTMANMVSVGTSSKITNTNATTSISPNTGNFSSKQCLLYATSSGTIGIFCPLTSQRQVTRLQAIEAALRGSDEKLDESTVSEKSGVSKTWIGTSHAAGIVGRDHLSYRSTQTPTKAVIDGDLVEQYLALSPDRAQIIATQAISGTAMTPNEIFREIQSLRPM